MCKWVGRYIREGDDVDGEGGGGGRGWRSLGCRRISHRRVCRKGRGNKGRCEPVVMGEETVQKGFGN